MSSEIKAIIVEDVESYLLTIEKLVLEVAPHVNIIGKSTTLTEAVQLIRKLKPNVILLDIQFEMEGKTAFDMLSELEATNDLNFQIIFITAHQEARYYALAFQFKALHFVEKPIDSEKLKEAFQRVNINIEAGFDPIVAKFGEIHKKMHTVGSNDRIVVEGNLYSELICVDEISTIEASGRYSTLCLTNGRKIISCKNLGEYEKQLSSYSKFIRIHNNRIINFNLVKRFSKKERLIELIEPQGKYYASKERFKDFLLLTAQNDK